MSQSIENGRNFGVEFEAYGLPKDTVVRILRDAGFDAVSAHYSSTDYTKWQIKNDCSINGANGFEIVSPILSGEAGIAQVRQVLDLVHEAGGQVNKSCGMHVHWGVSDWGVSQFRSLAKRWVKFEQAMDSIMPMSRRGNNNRYVQSNLRGFGSATSNEVRERQMRKLSRATTVRGIGAVFGHSRYVKLNFECFWRTGTIEFRHHSGTLCSKKAVNFLHLTSALVAQATNARTVKNFSENVTDEKSLTTMLNACVKHGGMARSVAKFFKNRQAALR